jgi:hypothetical protein
MKHFISLILISAVVLPMVVLPMLVSVPDAQAISVDIRIGGGNSATSEIPPGRAWSLDDIAYLIRSLTRRLIYISGVLAVFFIVLSGIMYMYAGDNETKIDKAKGMLKSGIIGSAIVFGVGVILLTVEAIVMGDFFGI